MNERVGDNRYMSLRPGMVLNSKYKIIKLLQKGGMGAVYLACDKKEKLVIKMKICRQKEDYSLLKWEFFLLSRLTYPHLPRVFDYFEENACSFLVEEFVEGIPLREKMQDRKYCENFLGISKIVCQIMGTLYYLNRRRIIYRDLKPAHIIISRDGFVRLVDFGAARIYKKKKTVDTIPLGTIGFASPEHYGYRQTDERSEVFTIGALLYSLLTGTNPADKPFIFHDPCASNPMVSGDISRIIHKATQMKPEDRYKNVKELRLNFQRAAGAVFQKKRLIFCPLCWTEMEIIRIDDLEIDVCSRCSGIWCDAMELEKIQKINHTQLSKYMDAYWKPALPDSEVSYPLKRLLCCPVCGLLMNTYSHGRGSGILLDRCKGGCGKWLDGGEMRLISEKKGRKALQSIIQMFQKVCSR